MESFLQGCMFGQVKSLTQTLGELQSARMHAKSLDTCKCVLQQTMQTLATTRPLTISQVSDTATWRHDEKEQGLEYIKRNSWSSREVFGMSLVSAATHRGMHHIRCMSN